MQICKIYFVLQNLFFYIVDTHRLNMKKLSTKNNAVICAYKKGYRVIDGNVFYNGNIVSNYTDDSGYYVIRVKNEEGKGVNIRVHRLAGYQKFGDKIFEKTLQIRHLNSDKNNNKEYNIGIGTQSENQMDRSPENRIAVAINASSYIKKHDHEKIIKLHNRGWSYDKIMKKLNIKSKGTISFIVRKSIVSLSNNQSL